MEPGDFVWMSISIISISRMPVADHGTLPLRRRAAMRPRNGGVASAGLLTQPALRGAHNPQVFRVFAVVHPPTVVFAVLQGLLRTIAAYVIHPNWTL